MMKLKRIVFALSFGPCICFADVGSDLTDFFNNSGFTSNVTMPSAYQGQEAGYYSGGGMYIQSGSRYIQPLSITAPSINAGCGGIDIFSGGMSFINSSELTAFAQNVMSNAAGYTLHLALATWAPQINQVLQFVQDAAQQINQYGMSSCQAAEDLVGGIWSMAGQNMKQVCQDMGDASNEFQGWVESAEGCSSNPSSVISSGQSQGIDTNSLQPNTNIAWKALSNDGIVVDDAILAEFLMTVSGTIVMDDSGNPNYYPPEYKNGDIIKALVQGGTAKIYNCDETSKCLNISQQNMTIIASKSLLALAKTNVDEVWTSMQNDTPLSTSLQAFLSQVNLPVMTILEATAMSGQDPEAIMNALSDYLAYYLLNQYLQWALDTVTASAETLNISQDVMNQFTTNIQSGQQYLEQDLDTKEQQYANMLQGMMVNNQLMQQVMGKSTTHQLENLEFEAGE